MTLGNAGAGLKGGLPFQPWAADLQKKRASEIGLNDPDGLCLPQGPLQYHVDPQPLKIAQLPRQILIIYESNYGLRTIYMDGRSLPALGKVQPYWHGYSVGRWEGDTLVVESNNFHGVDPDNPRAVGLPDAFLGAGWLDHQGSPYTEAMKLTERFRRVNYGQLDIELTVDDAKAYTKPFTVRVAPARRGGRLGADRIHLPREPDVPQADRPRAQVAAAAGLSGQHERQSDECPV